MVERGAAIWNGTENGAMRKMEKEVLVWCKISARIAHYVEPITDPQIKIQCHNTSSTICTLLYGLCMLMYKCMRCSFIQAPARKPSVSPAQECNRFSPPSRPPSLYLSLSHTETMKCTQAHSAQGTNHHRLFSGPVCEWDFYGRGRVRHHCICRHAAAPEEKKNPHPLLFHLLKYFSLFQLLSVAAFNFCNKCYRLYFFSCPCFHFSFCLLKLSLILFVLVFFLSKNLKKAFSMIFFHFSPDIPSSSPSSLVCLIYIFFNLPSYHSPIYCRTAGFTTASFCLSPYPCLLVIPSNAHH